MTWRMNSVPSAWGPEHSMWARCIEGVCKASAHCSSTAGSHSWWRTGAARVPTFWSSHAASRRRAGSHSWDWAEQAQRWGAVSGCAPQRRHVVSSTISRCPSVLRCPFSFLPPVTYRDQCQLSPTALSGWLQDRASIPARAGYETRWGVNYVSGGGLPLDWFDGDRQRHITAHRMDNIPTMTVLAQWCGVVWCGVVWCGVPKALLPKGKGRDVYPRVQVNGLGCVCCVRAVCKCVVA